MLGLVGSGTLCIIISVSVSEGGRDLVPFTYTDTDDYILLLYGSSDNCIQPDDGLIRKGRNT